MSERIHGLAQLLLGKSSLDECNLEELQHITKRYPFFAPAQFLLLQKLKETGSPDHEAQQRKAVLFYHDPLQFDYFISSDKFYFDEAVLRNENVAVTETSRFSEADDAIPFKSTVADEQSFTRQDENGTPGPENKITTSVEEDTTTVEELPQVAALLPAAEHPLDETAPFFSEPDNADDVEKIADAEPDVLTAHLLGESPRPEIIEESAAIEEEPAISAESTIMSTDPSPAVAPDEETELNEAAEETTPVQSETAKQGIIVPEKAASAGEPLSFEPFHTVDYFASQGIKITSEELPKDELSKQLRSFTEWLKIMKRLPAVEIEQSPQSTAEKSVEHMASHSVEGSDVVTEAMAEVWAKQGALEKAIETYNKLSLQIPSKKAYFDRKIENLSRS